MNLNLLIDRLPQTVTIGGVEYPIRSDFRTSILFELLVRDPDVSDMETIWHALTLYYPSVPRDLAAAVEKMIWFYSCGKEEPQLSDDPDGPEARSSKQVYSFEHDDTYIYAAFMQCYGIDLNRAKNLHWWKFRAMFKALPDDCQFMKILSYRSVKITSKMSKEQKTYYRRMKSLFALPLSREQQEHTDALTQALMNGGDLTGLL